MRIRYTRRAAGHLQAIRNFSNLRFGTRTTDATLAEIEVAIDALADGPDQGKSCRLASPGLSVTLALVVREPLRLAAVNCDG